MREFVDETEQQLLEPMQTAQIGQTNMWDAMRYGTQESPFAKDPQVEAHRRMIARHKLWLESITHEYPSPYEHYRIGIYIRYFNQTKYPNYFAEPNAYGVSYKQRPPYVPSAKPCTAAAGIANVTCLSLPMVPIAP